MGRGVAPEIESRSAVTASALFTSLLLSLSALPALAQDGDYRRARARLMDEEYAEAARVSSALAARAPSQATYRLLALAQSRLGQPAEAIWAYRCAVALGAPTSQSMIVEEVYAPLPPSMRPLPRRGIDALAGAVTRSPVPQLFASLALLAGLGLAAAFTLRLFAPAKLSAAGFILAGSAALLVLVTGLWLAFRQNTLAYPPEAVVLAEAPLREAPGIAAPELTELPRGAVVETGEVLSGMTAVTLPSGKTGWVESDVLRPVAPMDTYELE